MLVCVKVYIGLPKTPYECFGYAGEAISVGLIVIAVYEKFLWRYNPLEKMPKIYGEYTATLEYEDNTGFRKKYIKITNELW